MSIKSNYVHVVFNVQDVFGPSDSKLEEKKNNMHKVHQMEAFVKMFEYIRSGQLRSM